MLEAQGQIKPPPGRGRGHHLHGARRAAVHAHPDLGAWDVAGQQHRSLQIVPAQRSFGEQGVEVGLRQGRRGAETGQAVGVDARDVAFGGLQLQGAALDALRRHVHAGEPIALAGEERRHAIARLADHAKVAAGPQQVGDGGVHLRGGDNGGPVHRDAGQGHGHVAAGEGTVSARGRSGQRAGRRSRGRNLLGQIGSGACGRSVGVRGSLGRGGRGQG